MNLADFIATHMPALERDEPRHNLILGILGTAAKDPNSKLMTWTLGEPGACAVRSPGRPLVLGELDREQCRALTDMTADLDHPGVVGPDPAPPWFVARAVELGLSFMDPVPQRIYALREAPAYPGAAGRSRQVVAADAALFADWFSAFLREAVPFDPVPSRQELESAAGSGRYTFWLVDEEPVAMAGIARRSRTTGSVSGVYTPPAQRGRGYAGSVTAAVAERIFGEGKTAACLYTDLRNPASNRCYAKIGFKPVCDAWHFARQAEMGSDPAGLTPGTRPQQA
jgi:RimJ/RimL family protein N-acetyltransferase